MSIISNNKLKTLCQKHNWFTTGSAEQLEKIFCINENGCDLDELTTAIWLCSTQNRCDIKEALELEYGDQKRLWRVRAAQIAEYINRKVPSDWNRMSLDERRLYLDMSYTEHEQLSGLVDRDRICALEIWCELFNGSIQTVPASAIKEINKVISKAEGWITAENKIHRFGPYGVQRGFVRHM